MSIKIFISYSHVDETYRDTLEKHLANLKNAGVIESWHDRKITAGDNWQQSIADEMQTADVVLFFSPDFISSPACQNEIAQALKLSKTKKTTVVPIIIRTCDWKNTVIADFHALPRDARAVSTWEDKDAAWEDVRSGIHNAITKFRDKMLPKLQDDYKNDISRNPATNDQLSKTFVYPTLSEEAKLGERLEQADIDAEGLKDITTHKVKHVLIEGDEQSGKTALCKTLYLTYIDKGLFPVLVEGSKIRGKARLQEIVNEAFRQQYQSYKTYFNLPKEKRVLLIDDINDSMAKGENHRQFISAIGENFDCSIVFIDQLTNLASKGTDHNVGHTFSNYSIKEFGHAKRNELIQRCLGNENVPFDTNDNAQLLRLDATTKHIDTIIGTNLVPSYPVFIVATLNTIETLTPTDLKMTSYGHCYQALVTLQLGKNNVNAEDIGKHFNFLTELAYHVFSSEVNVVSEDQMHKFRSEYGNRYIFDNASFRNLVESGILCKDDNGYYFSYAYIFYYFVAKHISDNIGQDDVQKLLHNLMSTLHKKASSNIIILVIHHTSDSPFIDEILTQAKSIFKEYDTAALEKPETSFIRDFFNLSFDIPDDNHDHSAERNRHLQRKDRLRENLDHSNDTHTDENEFLIEIRKSAKILEILGQIMRNQHGIFPKNRLRELFMQGQNAGLRSLNCFIRMIEESQHNIESWVQKRIADEGRLRSSKLTQKRQRQIGNDVVAMLTLGLIFGWLHKVVDAIGYDKLIEIADDIDRDVSSPASNLINFSIHLWYCKNLDIEKMKVLEKRFDDANNTVSKHILRGVVARHLYMHKVDYKDKQTISSILGMDVKKQTAIQSKIKKK